MPVKSHGFTAKGSTQAQRRFYFTWTRMVYRCHFSGSQDFAYYGGRGILVNERWRKFENFRDDMWESYLAFGNNPTLERIKVNGSYEFSNCKWASRAEQNNNKRNNHIITFKEKTKTLTQWAKFLNIPRENITWRLRRGWSVEEALTTP